MPPADQDPNHDSLLRNALNGDETALAELFGAYQGRLRRMVELRLNRLVWGRVNPSDVLQEAFIDLANEIKKKPEKPQVPLFVLARRLTGRRLDKVHRTHLGAAMRDASREVSIYRGRMPQATSHALASKLVGDSTSIVSRIEKAERQIKLQEVLNAMDESDREVLAMRHFEGLLNSEVAAVLEISEQAASMRHLRALQRLHSALSKHPDLFRNVLLDPGAGSSATDDEP